MSTDFSNNTGAKSYTIRMLDDGGKVLQEKSIEAASGDAAAKQLRDVVAGTEKIEIRLDGQTMNEMGVEYWAQRMRRR